MGGMTGSDGELKQVRQVLEEARRALEAVGRHGADGHGRNSLPLLIHHLHQVLQVAEDLAARHEQYESRLHRTPQQTPAQSLHTPQHGRTTV